MATMNAQPRPPALELAGDFVDRADPEQAAHLARFFKTGPGHYGEGDKFLGIKVPITRTLIKRYRGMLEPGDYAWLLQSEWHEIRLAALLLMVDSSAWLARTGSADQLRQLVDLYDRLLERANNWDLIDMSARDLMGNYWKCCRTGKTERKAFLKKWADSPNLWRQRAAMVSTYALIKQDSLDETFWLAEYFINHPHDLMHKAVGWMLREAGKKDRDALRSFLANFHTRLPRTALRYAIEHFDVDEKRRWMAK
ncbi:MAG: DNA alkylation repair protein [Planctomycetes bacterium]|nr:DNA alkylation repair protein [Planctomycetota bacterium]